MTDQPSMEQMRQLVAEDECRMRGHSWDVITASDGQPIWVLCARCGRRWSVDLAHQPGLGHD